MPDRRADHAPRPDAKHEAAQTRSSSLTRWIVNGLAAVGLLIVLGTVAANWEAFAHFCLGSFETCS